MMSIIRCVCNKVIWDGEALKIRIGLFRDGYMTLKCSSCRRFLQGISIKYLTNEIKEDLIFKD